MMKAKIVLKVLTRTVLPILLGLGVLVLIIAVMIGAFVEKIEPAATVRAQRRLPPDRTVDLAEVYEVEKEYFAEAVGTLRAATRTEIAARILAPIDEVHVKAGDLVKKGSVLVRLDPRGLRSQLDQAQSALDAAQVSLTHAESDLQRDTKLHAERILPTMKFEQSKTDVQLARSRVRQLEQAVSEAEVSLSYTTIVASQDGMIVDRLAEPGDIAQPGVPLLVLYDPQSLRLEAPVMENLAVKLKIGDVLPVHIDALERDVEARVDEIVPQAEAASRSFLVKVALTDAEGLYEGMFGRLRIPSGIRRHLCLPVAAIQPLGQLQFVDVVTEDGETLERRFITTGRLGSPYQIEVLSGLEAGDRVVLYDAGRKTGETDW
jgi:membrane fusion protein, multidrug efflux system